MMAMLEHLAIVAVMAAVLSTGCTDVVKETQFKITTKRDNDKMEVKVGKEKTIFSVHSPFGISQADIERSNIWPDTVILRMHLKGLEDFKVTNGIITLEAAVSSQDGKVRLWKDGNEDSPLGRDISNRQALIDVVAEAGLERQVAESMLGSNEPMDVIEEAGELSGRHGGMASRGFHSSSSIMRSLCLVLRRRIHFLMRSGR